MIGLDPIYLESVVRCALDEDLGSGDVTTLLTVPQSNDSSAVIIAHEPGVAAGLPVAQAVFEALDSGIVFDAAVADGEEVGADTIMAKITGTTRTILSGERVALNFLQRMSGIATLTRAFVAETADTRARIVDTRKTTPGLRRLEKYSVAVGGGSNHRFGLGDGILIKDNHIASAGGITSALAAARKSAPHNLRIEIEVSSLNQLEQALDGGADAVLLDNMEPELMQQAVEMVAGRAVLEASGGITLQNAAAVAKSGVDLISVGALTHSVKALDISLDIQ